MVHLTDSIIVKCNRINQCDTNIRVRYFALYNFENLTRNISSFPIFRGKNSKLSNTFLSFSVNKSTQSNLPRLKKRNVKNCHFYTRDSLHSFFIMAMPMAEFYGFDFSFKLQNIYIETNKRLFFPPLSLPFDVKRKKSEVEWIAIKKKYIKMVMKNWMTI